MSELIHPVILCGGGGTRLWPMSRPARAKPFLPLLGERTLFQQALDRVSGGGIFAGPTVVAGEAHVGHIREQGGDALSLIVEPCGRNTAPAIALAAARLPVDAVMLVCPSDHHIGDVPAFVTGAQAAAHLAKSGCLVAFGIAPDRPETGYGYLQRGEPMEGGFVLDRFVEKPDRARAEQFLADGRFSWNGGIFAFTAGRFMEELSRHRPDMAVAVRQAVAAGASDGATFRPDAGPFEGIAGESVDYAVMENTDRAAMVPVSMGWSDIGNWQALHEARAAGGADAQGNVADPRHELAFCSNVMAFSDGPRISVVGLDGVIVVVDGDEVLVTSADGAQAVGQLAGAKGK
ncbi:sugar phosphate nucleotidyltransferase [Erythrobacteraceae bacterium WH01K]|nr:sugar phosphate nucleotidyltransferase [Erythrobacteraceae bacterium WH01K]